MAETAKEKADTDLWKELESQHAEHIEAMETLRQQLDDDKMEAINDVSIVW